jgi:glycolate oxidase FAD binding subunit
LAAECAGWELVEADASAALWRDVRDVTPFAGREGVVWRVSVKPSDGPRLVEALGGPEAILDWGGGLVWLLLTGEADVRTEVAAFGGHATLVRAPEPMMRAKVPAFQPEAAPVAAISRGLREKFDPRGILNPGLMG